MSLCDLEISLPVCGSSSHVSRASSEAHPSLLLLTRSSPVFLCSGPCSGQMAFSCLTPRPCSCCFPEEFPGRCVSCELLGTGVRRAGCQVGREHLCLCPFPGPAGVRAARLGGEETGVLTPAVRPVPASSGCPAVSLAVIWGFTDPFSRTVLCTLFGPGCITGGNTRAVEWRCRLPVRTCLPGPSGHRSSASILKIVLLLVPG